MKTKFTVEMRKLFEGTERECIKECAVTEDGEVYQLSELDGIKYFYIDNPYDKSSLSARRFYNRIYDAVRAVREDYADALVGPTGDCIFSFSTKPVVFLDRDKAEEYRQKTLDGWKDAEFGYSVYCGSKKSMSGYSEVFENGDFGILASGKQMIFKTEDEAKAKLNEYVDKAREIAKTIANAENPGEEYSNMINSNTPFVIERLIDCFIEFTDKDGKTCKYTDDWTSNESTGAEIRQAVKRKEVA